VRKFASGKGQGKMSEQAADIDVEIVKMIKMSWFLKFLSGYLICSILWYFDCGGLMAALSMTGTPAVIGMTLAVIFDKAQAAKDKAA
jgi:hypothetical protein